jgi:hypothetical protein
MGALSGSQIAIFVLGDSFLKTLEIPKAVPPVP